MIRKEAKIARNQVIMKKKITLKDILFLQAVVVVFTVSSIVAKFASVQEFMTFEFVLFYGLEVAVLGSQSYLQHSSVQTVYESQSSCPPL